MAHGMPHDWDAAAYDRISEPQLRWGGSVASRLELDGDEVVLDAGCGTGRVTQAVLERLPHGTVIGLDGSAAMAGTARRQLAAYADRLRLVVADLRHPLPIALGSLDAIISTATLHWLPDHDSVFQHFAEALRPGGQLVAQCGGRGNIDSVVRALQRVAPGEGYPWTYAAPEQTEARLAAAGFGDTATWLSDELTHFDTRTELEDFLATVVLWPQLQARPPQEHAAFVAAVVDELPGQELDYVRLNIVARRRPAAG